MDIGTFDNPLIKKSIISSGTTYKKILPETKVKFHFITRKCDDGHTVIDDSKKMGKPMELVIGRQFKLEVWETIVKAMSINEVASFVVDKSLVHAYPLVSRTLRDAQNPDKARSRHRCGHMLQSFGMDQDDLNSLLKNPCDLEFIIELLEVENAGEYGRETWQLNEKERLDEVPVLKEEGNVLYKDGKYSEAAEKYSKAIGFLDQLMLCEKPGEPEWTNLQNQKMGILLNYAQCKLSLNEFYEVIEHCTTVLEHDPNGSMSEGFVREEIVTTSNGGSTNDDTLETVSSEGIESDSLITKPTQLNLESSFINLNTDNVKALYRRAKAHTNAWNVTEARSDLENLIKYDPSMMAYAQQQLNILKNIDKEKEMALKENIKGKLFK